MRFQSPLEYFFEKVNLKKISRRPKNHEKKIQAYKEVWVWLMEPVLQDMLKV